MTKKAKTKTPKIEVWTESGEDSDGKRIESVDEIWKAIETKKKEAWYDKADEYWETQESSINGMLGGFSELDVADIRESKLFIQSLKLPQMKTALGKS